MTLLRSHRTRFGVALSTRVIPHSVKHVRYWREEVGGLEQPATVLTTDAYCWSPSQCTASVLWWLVFEPRSPSQTSLCIFDCSRQSRPSAYQQTLTMRLSHVPNAQRQRLKVAFPAGIPVHAALSRLTIVLQLVTATCAVHLLHEARGTPVLHGTKRQNGALQKSPAMTKQPQE